MPYLLVPLALEVEVTLSGLPVVDDMVVVLAAALVTRPVLGVAVPPIGAVDWLLISCCIVKLNWPNMLVKLRVACTYMNVSGGGPQRRGKGLTYVNLEENARAGY